MLVGINGFLDETTLEPFKEAGFSLYREGISWPDVQKEDGSWDWSASDRIADLCAKAGAQWIPIVFWPLGDSWPLTKYPELKSNMGYLAEIQDWIAFLQGLVTRYEDIVYIWEIGQSPSCGYSGWREPDHSLAGYVRFLHHCMNAIYNINVDCRVMPGSGDPEVPIAYYADLFSNGLFRQDIGALGFQFYYNNEFNSSRLWDSLHMGVNELHRMIADKVLGNNVPLLITESGWPVDDLAASPSEQIKYSSLNYTGGVIPVDPMTQCHRIERILYHANILGIEAILLHTMRDNIRPDGSHMNIWGDHCGLLDSNLKPRDAYHAAKDWISRNS